jgi:hypothetical protein
MSDEARLAAVWAADEPPARDVAFGLDVMARILRRRLWIDAAALAPVVVAAGILLWVLAPIIGGIISSSSADADTLIWLLVGLGVAAAVFVVDMLRPGAA